MSYVSTERCLQFSGEVEGLVPANHAATGGGRGGQNQR